MRKKKQVTMKPVHSRNVSSSTVLSMATTKREKLFAHINRC